MKHMLAVEVKIRKEYMQFKGDKGEDVKMGGLRIILGPKVEKFVTLENYTTGNNSTAELLGYTNPNLVQWYYNSSAGAELILCEKQDNSSSELKKIYIKEENEL